MVKKTEDPRGYVPPANLEAGFCQCGCGQRTGIAPRTDNRFGHIKSQPFPFVVGHSSKTFLYQRQQKNGLCECGCGQKVIVRPGRRNRFIKGHSNKGKPGKCGKDNPNWKGGKKLNDQGYVLIRDRGYPRSDTKGDVREAIMVVEKAMGKPLPPKAVVHHVNGKKADNSRGNHVACQDQAYHMLLHQRMRALKACGHANWLKCPYCKEYDDPQNLHINRKAHYHTNCQTDYQRKRYGKKRTNPIFSPSLFRV